VLRGTPTQWLEAASEDFVGFVAARRGARSVGSAVHDLLVRRRRVLPGNARHPPPSHPELAENGGHIGYHVEAPWRRLGHATRMLAAGLDQCRQLGLNRVLLTCDTDNQPSRRVILANDGVPDDRQDCEYRFWNDLDSCRDLQS
jgi:GNAT superfamily N-acetyltransferase